MDDLELKSAVEWDKLYKKLYSEFAVFCDGDKFTIDLEVAKMLSGFDYLIPEISKAEVVARTNPKYFKLKELLQNFNNQLQDCRELFLLRMMNRNF